MQSATVIGKATSTAKHPSFEGWRLLVVQPLDNKSQPDGFPLLAIDSLGCAAGDRVIITSDGKGVREMVGRKDSPIRFAVMGLQDDV